MIAIGEKYELVLSSMRVLSLLEAFKKNKKRKLALHHPHNTRRMDLCFIDWWLPLCYSISTHVQFYYF